MRRYKLPAAARLGDIALALIFGLQGLLIVRRAIGYWTDRDLLAGIHLTLVASAAAIYTVLFLIRGPAIGKSDRIGPKLVAAAGTWAIIPLAALPLTWRPGWLLTVSTLGLIAAYAFVIWALFTLRRNLSIFPEARELIRHGPYGLVRHPLYSAYITCYVLIAVPRISAWALLLAGIGIVCEILRARNEERVLRAAFAEYDGYAAVTPRFLPRARHLIGDAPRLRGAAAAVGRAR
jgi:protein-S-isoprenylcysteine O-methyltransferase Ste14